MRIVNRLLAFIVAVALLGVSVIVIVEVIGFAINGESVLVPWMTWEQWAERTHFNSTVIKVWSIILIVAGAILLIAELKPRRVTRVGLQSDSTSHGDGHYDKRNSSRGEGGNVRSRWHR